MKRIIYLENMSAWGKLFLLISLIILSSLFTAFFGLLAGKLYFNVDLSTLSSFIEDPQSAKAIGFVKFYQLLNQIGVFIIPVIVFSFLVSPSITNYLDLHKKPGLMALLISGLIIYTVLPFNHYLLTLNQGIDFPAWFSGIENWMIDYEAKAETLTKAFLTTDSVYVLGINLIIVALIPAVGEEWLFRGVLLKLFKQITGNYHWSILITAILFAALHLQFLSLFPRILLGLILGYLFVLTRSLWVPIFAHFVNNASSVIIFYLHYNGKLKVSVDDFGASSSLVYIIGSFLITAWLLVILMNRERMDFKEIK